MGGGVIKQRIARKGQGKSGAYRSIILFRYGDKAFFVHGFAKSEQSNISAKQLILFKSLAADMFSLNEQQLQTLLDEQEFKELSYDQSDI